MAELKRHRVEALCSFVDAQVRASGCDHTLRFTREWAATQSFNWDDLHDILDQHSCFCDCEVVMNLPDDADLVLKEDAPRSLPGNAWAVPDSFACLPTNTFSRRIVCDARLGKNNHASDGELLVPAPRGAKPRKRVRKIVHFFVGCASGMPTEVGVVMECPPVSAEEFARAIVESSQVPELKELTFREAAFFLSKVAPLPPGTPVATDILQITGVSGKREELRIHKVFLRKA